MGTSAMAKKCRTCGALCCRYITVHLSSMDDEVDWDEARWFLLHERVMLICDEDGEWILQVDTDCKMLDAESRCTTYATRPQVCRGYPPAKECEKDGGSYGYIKSFLTVAEFDAWMTKEKGKRYSRWLRTLNPDR